MFEFSETDNKQDRDTFVTAEGSDGRIYVLEKKLLDRFRCVKCGKIANPVWVARKSNESITVCNQCAKSDDLIDGQPSYLQEDFEKEVKIKCQVCMVVLAITEFGSHSLKCRQSTPYNFSFPTKESCKNTPGDESKNNPFAFIVPKDAGGVGSKNNPLTFKFRKDTAGDGSKPNAFVFKFPKDTGFDGGAAPPNSAAGSSSFTFGTMPSESAPSAPSFSWAKEERDSQVNDNSSEQFDKVNNSEDEEEAKSISETDGTYVLCVSGTESQSRTLRSWNEYRAIKRPKPRLFISFGYADGVITFQKRRDLQSAENKYASAFGFLDTMREDEVLTMVLKDGLKHGWETLILHETVRRRHVPILRELLKCGVFVDNLDEAGRTPLMLAYEMGYLEECLALITYDANPHHCDLVKTDKVTYRMKYMLKIAKQFWIVPKVDVEATVRASNHIDWDVLEKPARLQLNVYCDSAVRFLQHKGTDPVHKFQLYNMREVREIHHAIIGQPFATSQIERCFASYRAANSSPILKTSKPQVFLLAGPSGHGKSETARLMGRILFPRSHEMDCIFIDCANHSRQIEMFGASGAYQGSEEGSALNNFIVAHSGRKGIVILDEFEKTSYDTQEGFLSVFDTGKYIDKRLLKGRGDQTRAVDASQLVFFLTTNALDGKVINFFMKRPEICRDLTQKPALDRFQNQLRKSARTTFGSPLTNRIDQIIPFFPFDEESLMVLAETAVGILVTAFKAPPTENRSASGDNSKYYGNIDLIVEESVLAELIEDYDQQSGARAIRRAIDRVLMQELIHCFRSEKLINGRKYRVLVNDDGVVQLISEN